MRTQPCPRLAWPANALYRKYRDSFVLGGNRQWQVAARNGKAEPGPPTSKFTQQKNSTRPSQELDSLLLGRRATEQPGQRVCNCEAAFGQHTRAPARMRASMQAHTHAGMRNTSKQHEHASTPTCKHATHACRHAHMRAHKASSAHLTLPWVSSSLSARSSTSRCSPCSSVEVMVCGRVGVVRRGG